MDNLAPLSLDESLSFGIKKSVINMSKKLFQLLRLLSDGEIYSISKIEMALDVSVEEVLKLIQELQTQPAVTIKSINGVGFQLYAPFNFLNKTAIDNFICKESSGIELFPIINIVEIVASTNDLALASQGPNCNNLQVWFAEYQHSGRGRRGNVWQSSVLGNIYGSIIWRFSGGYKRIQALSLVVGISMAEALNEIGLSGVKLKWPNDIWVDGKKLGGILVEIPGNIENDCAAVIGFGINVYTSTFLESSVDQKITALSVYLGNIDRNTVVAHCLRKLVIAMKDLDAHGFAIFKSRWEKFDTLKGNQIKILSTINPKEGICLGINDHGALMLQTREGIEEVLSGEISVRSI